MRTLLLGMFLGAVACSKQEPPAPLATNAATSATATPPVAQAPSGPAATPSAAAPVPSASASAARASSELPTEEDFEDEASRAVTAKTLDAQLDALEKEIQAD
jgi:hypothetical protein